MSASPTDPLETQKLAPAEQDRGGLDPYALPATRGRNQMSSHLMGQLLDAVMYRIPMDVRRQVMQEVPAAYNAWYGRGIVVTQAIPASEGEHDQPR